MVAMAAAYSTAGSYDIIKAEVSGGAPGDELITNLPGILALSQRRPQDRHIPVLVR